MLNGKVIHSPLIWGILPAISIHDRTADDNYRSDRAGVNVAAKAGANAESPG